MSPIQKPRLHRFDQYNRPNRPWMKRVFLQKDLRSLTLAVPNRILDQSDAAGVSNSKSTTDRRVRTKWAPHVPFLQFGNHAPVRTSAVTRRPFLRYRRLSNADLQD